MNKNEVVREKYLINSQDGANNPERATVFFILGFTTSKTCKTAVFFLVDAAQLFVTVGPAGVKAEGYESLFGFTQWLSGKWC